MIKTTLQVIFVTGMLLMAAIFNLEYVVAGAIVLGQALFWLVKIGLILALIGLGLFFVWLFFYMLYALLVGLFK